MIAITTMLTVMIMSHVESTKKQMSAAAAEKLATITRYHQ